MKLKYCCKWAALAAFVIMGIPALAADKPSSTSAEFYKLHPEAYADKEITLEICFVRAFNHKSPVPELAFLHAATYDTKNDRPGGIITVVIPKENIDKMVKKYGSFPEGGRRWNWDSEKLKGTFRIGPHGHFYLDVDGGAAVLLKGKDLPNEPDPVVDGGAGPGPRRPKP